MEEKRLGEDRGEEKREGEDQDILLRNKSFQAHVTTTRVILYDAKMICSPVYGFSLD